MATTHSPSATAIVMRVGSRTARLLHARAALFAKCSVRLVRRSARSAENPPGGRPLGLLHAVSFRPSNTCDAWLLRRSVGRQSALHEVFAGKALGLLAQRRNLDVHLPHDRLGFFA